MRGLAGWALVGCTGAGSVGSDTAGTSNGLDGIAAEICAQSGVAERTLNPDQSEPILADGIPVFVEGPLHFGLYRIDPLGAEAVSLFYDGGNSVTALFKEDVDEEWIGNEKGEWADCPGLRVRQFPILDEATITAEVNSNTWLLAIPTDRLPDDLLR